MGTILDLSPEERERLHEAYLQMEKERSEKNAEIIPTSYAGITDFYTPFDMHFSFFFDPETEKLFARTFYYASGLVIYEEIQNPDRLINESDASRTIAWVLLRSGVFLYNK